METVGRALGFRVKVSDPGAGFGVVQSLYRV